MQFLSQCLRAEIAIIAHKALNLRIVCSILTRAVGQACHKKLEFMKSIDTAVKHKIIHIVRSVLPDVQIYLFGSRARGTANENSDIDIAIQSTALISRFAVYEIKSMLDASRIPVAVDVVDLGSVSDDFKHKILAEAVVWTD